MSRRRSGLSGVTRLRRVLRRVEPESLRELKDAVREGGEAVKQDQIAGAPIKEGDMVREIDAKLGRDGLTVVVGPGARHVSITKNPFGRTRKKMSAPSKRALFQFFKAYWYEFGTKGYSERNIPPQPARPFLGPAFDVNRAWILQRSREGIRLALQRASRGAGPRD